jgi:hypothetical protein
MNRRARYQLAQMYHELSSRDREDGRATGQPQGVGSEAYLNGTSQGPTTEDARKDGQIRGRSRRFVKYLGYLTVSWPAPSGSDAGPLVDVWKR